MDDGWVVLVQVVHARRDVLQNRQAAHPIELAARDEILGQAALRAELLQRMMTSVSESPNEAQKRTMTRQSGVSETP